jgi:type II secretion system protein N
MKERILAYVLKYAPSVGYPLFYVFCLAVFLPLTFPYDRLKERIVASFNAAQAQPALAGQAGPGQQELQIEDLSWYWLSGVRMKGVGLLTAQPEPGKPPSKLEIDEATARYSLLPMLIGYSSLGFDVLAFGGEASGSYDQAGKQKSVEVTLEAIDLGEVDPLVQLLGIPLAGKLGGSIRLVMPDGKATKGNGAVALEAKDVSVGDGKAKLKGTIALPKIDVGPITLSAEAKDGILKITKLVAGGKDVELQGDGRIMMRELATDSLCEVQVRFKINDAYKAKSDLTKSLFGAPGSNASGLFELADAKIRQSKRADGFYVWNMRGPLGSPEFVPVGGPAPAGPQK